MRGTVAAHAAPCRPMLRHVEDKSIRVIPDILPSCQAGRGGKKRLKGFNTRMQRLRFVTRVS